MLEKNIFDISDTLPFKLAEFDLIRNRLFTGTIKEDYPLYYIIKFLRTAAKVESALSLDTFHQVCKLTLQKLKNTKWVLNKGNLSTFIDHIDYITIYMEALMRKEHFKGPLMESMVQIFSAIEKNVQVKSAKTQFQRNVGLALSDTLTAAAMIQFQSGQLQMAEVYCLRQLAHLKTLSNFNLEDLMKRKIATQVILARIYLKEGEPHLALDFLRVACSALNQYYYSESIYNLPDVVGLYKELLGYFYKNDLSKVFNLYHSFLEMQATIKTKQARLLARGQQQEPHILAPRFSEAMQKDIQFIHLIAEQAKQKYPQQFNEDIANSAILKNTVHQVAFNFDSRKLILTFKDVPSTYLMKAFKAKKIHYIHDSDECFRIDINACSAKQLERVCQYALNLQAEYLTHQAEQLRIKEALAQSSLHQPLVISHAEIIPAETKISPPKAGSSKLTTPQERTKPNPPKKPGRRKEKTEDASDKAVQQTKNKPIQKIRYDRPCGLVYDSTLQNKGQVKQLINSFSLSSDDRLSDDRWFGYIPDELKEHAHYNKEFENKLIRGLIEKNCIRYIVKELQTRAPHNNTAKHPYKFKIVVKDHDYRIYGWIEDVMIDEEGRNHYLICFGLLWNHKKLERASLPDSDIIRKRYTTRSTVDQTALNKEQLVKKQLTTQFIEHFVELAYSDKLPEALTEQRGKFVNAFYSNVEHFSKETFTLEQAHAFFGSLKAVCNQMVVLGETEPGSAQQLEVAQNIIRLLSKLDEDKEIYLLVILPLLNAMQTFEQSSFVATKAGKQITDGAVTAEQILSSETEDDKLAQQLIEQLGITSHEATAQVSRLEERLETNPDPVEDPSDKGDITAIHTELNNKTQLNSQFIK